MRIHMHHLTLATVAALIAWSAPLPATEYEASDYLPLAVGNSWTFGHEWYALDGYGLGDRYTPGDWPNWHNGKRFTITVERTEVIAGETYYVLSEMPSGWPPAPPHFPAGKKLRWDGTSLVEHDGTGEQTFFRFDGAGAAGYTIPTTEGDNRVTAMDTSYRVVPEHTFFFWGYDGYGDWPSAGRFVSFLAGYGFGHAAEGISDTDYPIFLNQLTPIQATLTGGSQSGASGQSGTSRVVTYEDVHYGRTSAAGSSWGEVKEGERP